MDRRSVLPGWRVLVLALLMLPAPWGLAQNSNVTVDEQPSAEQRLEGISELRQAGRHDTAAELIQETLDEVHLKLVGLGEGRYTDIERWCREELLRDPVLQAAYRERQTAVAERALEQARLNDDTVGALRGVYRLYIATRPALEAGLELAGRWLAQGEFQAANALVKQLAAHPDAGLYKNRLSMLNAATALYTLDAERFVFNRGELQQAGEADLVAQLDALQASLMPSVFENQQVQDDTGLKPAELKSPLWDQPISEAERSAAWVRPKGIIPVLTESLTLMNNGRQVVAMDRASGQRLWVYPPDTSTQVTDSATLPRWYDERAVAVGGGVICAVLGDSYGIKEVRNPMVPRNHLVCIDEVTGKPRWERRSGLLEEGEPTQAEGRRPGRANLEYTHFLGTPIITQGQVFVLLRRATDQVSQTTWLMSYDLETGRLRWFRHLALVSLGYSGDSNNVSPQMVLEGETLYLTDGLAAVAALDTRSGEYDWLRVLSVGFSRKQLLTVSTNGINTPPVLTSAGLLVPLSLSGDRLVLLNPQDGSTLQNFNEHPTIGKAQYILDGDDQVVVVSQDAVALWDPAKSEVLWSYKLGPSEKIAGRGDVSRRFVFVPTDRRMLVLDRSSGEVLGQAESSEGNIVQYEGEVLTTAPGRLYAFTSWERAYNRLVGRVVDEPSDHTAGLALASLAAKQGGKTEAVMQGVGFALDAIAMQQPDEAEQTRQRVFDQLRALALMPDMLDTQTRGLMYDRLALATQTAEQEVAYHLDVGRLRVTQGDIASAVDHFQSVIADPAFAAQPYALEGTTRSAGAVAQGQILELMQTYGRGVYGRYEAMARAQLAEMRDGGRTDASALSSIARRYPLSRAAVTALLEAGQVIEASGEMFGAIGLYQQAVVRAEAPLERQRAVGMLLNLYLKLARPEQASFLLEREAKHHPDLYPLDGEDPLSHAAWRERIELVKAKTRHALPPQLSASFGMPVLLDGRLLEVAPGIDAEPSSGRLLLYHDDKTLSCRTAAALDQPLWETRLPGDAAAQWLLLADSPEQTLVWSPGQGIVLSLDPQTGQKRWSASLGLTSTKPREAIDEDEQDDVSLPLVAVSDAAVCFGQPSTAELVVIDRAAGGVLWRSKLAMARLTAIDADAWTLAAAGQATPGQAFGYGRLALINLFTGEPVGNEPFRRIDVVPTMARLASGRVVLCGWSRVAAYNAQTSDQLWATDFSDRRLTGTAAINDRLVAVEVDGGEIQLFEHRRGQRLARAMGDARFEPGRTTLTIQGNGVWVCSSDGLSRIDLDDGASWRGAAALKGPRPTRMLLGREHVMMLTEPAIESRLFDENGPIEKHSRSSLFVFERVQGRLIDQYTLGPVRGTLDVDSAELFGSGFVVPADGQVLVVPGEPGEQ